MLLLALTTLALASTVQLQAGVEYAAGTRVATAEIGFSFLIPARWKGALPEGAEAMVLGSDTDAGLVLVTGQRGWTVAEARDLLSQPMPLDVFTVLQPAGTPRVSGQTVSQRFTTSPDLVAHARGRVLGDTGVLFIVMGPSADTDRLSRLADTLASGARSAAAAPPVATATHATVPTGALAAGLKGRKVYYLKSDNGFSDEWSAYLCSDGTAHWSSSSTAMSGGATTLTYAGQASARGVWTVQGSSLVVAWNDGTHTNLPLTRANGSVRVAQSNHWVRDQDFCR